MTNWKKAGTIVHEQGRTVIYKPDPEPRHARFTIESRKRAIPHSNRSGTWDFTSYFVCRDGVDLIEKNSLADAKREAELIMWRDKKKWQL